MQGKPRRKPEPTLQDLCDRAKKAYIDADEITSVLMKTFRPDCEIGRMATMLYVDLFQVKQLIERLEQ
jgi:hypothetical protein